MLFRMQRIAYKEDLPDSVLHGLVPNHQRGKKVQEEEPSQEKRHKHKSAGLQKEEHQSFTLNVAAERKHAVLTMPYLLAASGSPSE